MKKKCVIIFSFITVMILVFAGMSAVMAKPSGIIGLLAAMRDYYEGYFYAMGGIALLILYLEKRKGGLSIAKTVILETLTVIAVVIGTYCVDKIPFWSILGNVPYILVFLLKMALSLLMAWGIGKIGLFLSNIDYHFPELWERWKWFFVFSILFIEHFFFQSPKEFNGWASQWYAMNYSDGLGSRFLPGAILAIFTRGGFVSSKLIMAYIVLAVLTVCVLTAFMLNEYIYRAKEGTGKAAVFLSILFLVVPGNIEYLWTEENLGRIETFVLVFLFMGIILFHKAKSVFARYLILSLTAILCVACYQAFCFLYFPVLFTVMVVDVSGASHHHTHNTAGGLFSQRHLVGLFIVCAVTAISFIVFQFMSHVNYSSSDEMVTVLEQRTDMEITEEVIYRECFSDVKEAWHAYFEGNIIDGNSWMMRELGFTVILTLFPVVVLWIAMYRKMISVDSEKSLFYSRYFWIILSDCAIIPQFLLTMDWGRWFSALVIVQFFQIMYLFYSGDEGCVRAMEALERFIAKYKILCIFVVLFLASQTRFEAAIMSRGARRILKVICAVIGKIM